ncbi:zinc finger MYM-type protein 1-like [Halichondria panicea]|uniref:zinc finger MYM-type protein 1-like n=1 Tax=Halichondria panicea TaxID=6063 RepID=UPI00312B7272
MDIRNYLSNSRKRSHKEVASDSDSDSDSTSDNESVMPDPRCTQPAQLVQSKSDKKKAYKSKLTYRQQWKLKYSWIDCANAEMGMFCVICKKYGKPPGNARGAWTTRGITDWNHATEMLKLHNDSKWHKDAAITAQMAQQSDLSVLELQNAASARDTKERKKKNQAIILKLLCSIYFLIKHRIPHTTTFNDLLALQVANGDEQLAHHLEQSPGNAMYTSKFSLTSLIEAIATWLRRKLLKSLRESPFFSILADECEDISTQEELSICCRWIVDGQAEEHFISVLHVLACDAETITEAIESFIASSDLQYRKLVGQGYDGAAVFSGCRSGVQVRMRTHAAHAVHVHCACHRLQLASIQAAKTVPEIQKVFGMMGNIWKLFYYSPKKMQALKEVQAVLGLPELKVVKPSDTRWLSHERCMRAIRKELPALITTLQQLYETTGDAEAFGLSTLLSCFTGVASICFLSYVLDTLAKMMLPCKGR